MTAAEEAVTADVAVVTDALGICGKVVKRSEDIPILGAVSVATGGGRLTFSGTDGRTFVKVSVPCVGEFDDSRAVLLRRLTTLMPAASRRTGNTKAPKVELAFVESGKKLALNVAGREFELETLAAADMEEAPSMSAATEAVTYEMPADLRAALDFAMPAASVDPERVMLGGVLFLRDVVGCTDGHRVHATTGFPHLAPLGTALPLEAGEALAHALKLVQPASVLGLYDEHLLALCFSFKGKGGTEVTITGKVPGLEVPDFIAQTRRPEAATVVQVSTSSLWDALVMARKTAEESYSCVLHVERGTLLVRASDSDGTTCAEKLKAEVTLGEGRGKSVVVQLSPRYAQEAIVGQGPQLTLYLGETTGAAAEPVVFSGENPRRLAVVMPQRRDE